MLVENELIAFTIVKYAICIGAEFLRKSFTTPRICGSLPYYLIYEVVLSKYFIHENLYVMTDMPIQMNINRSSFAHHTLNRHQVFIHPVQVFLLIPNVTIHLFLKSFQFFNVKFLLCLGNRLCHFGIASDVHLLGIVGSAGEGRVNVDQINFDPLLFQVGTSGNTFATDDHAAVRVLAHGLLLLHFVQWHPPLENHLRVVGTLVFQDPVEV